MTFNSTVYQVFCQTVQVSWSNNTTAKPKVNGSTVVEVQTHSFENPTYTLQGVQLIEDVSSSTFTALTYPTLLSMARNKYDGTNGITFSVDYGVSSSKYLVGSNGSTTAIPVVIKSFNFPINTMDIYSDGSNKWHLPALTIVLQETA